MNSPLDVVVGQGKGRIDRARKNVSKGGGKQHFKGKYGPNEDGPPEEKREKKEFPRHQGALKGKGAPNSSLGGDKGNRKGGKPKGKGDKDFRKEQTKGAGRWTNSRSAAQVEVPHNGQFGEMDKSVFDRRSQNTRQLESGWATKLQEEYNEKRERETRKQVEDLNRAREKYEISKSKDYQNFVLEQKMKLGDVDDSSSMDSGFDPRREASLVSLQQQQQQKRNIAPSPTPGPFESECLQEDTCFSENGFDQNADAQSSGMISDIGSQSTMSAQYEEKFEKESNKSITDPSEVRRLHEAVQNYTSHISRQQESNKALGANTASKAKRKVSWADLSEDISGDDDFIFPDFGYIPSAELIPSSTTPATTGSIKGFGPLPCHTRKVIGSRNNGPDGVRLSFQQRIQPSSNTDGYDYDSGRWKYGRQRGPRNNMPIGGYKKYKSYNQNQFNMYQVSHQQGGLMSPALQAGGGGGHHPSFSRGELSSYRPQGLRSSSNQVLEHQHYHSKQDPISDSQALQQAALQKASQRQTRPHVMHHQSRYQQFKALAPEASFAPYDMPAPHYQQSQDMSVHNVCVEKNTSSSGSSRDRNAYAEYYANGVCSYPGPNYRSSSSM